MISNFLKHPVSENLYYQWFLPGFWIASKKCRYVYIYIYIYKLGGACGVMVIVRGRGHGDPSSNPGQGCLHFTLC